MYQRGADRSCHHSRNRAREDQADARTFSARTRSSSRRTWISSSSAAPRVREAGRDRSGRSGWACERSAAATGPSARRTRRGHHPGAPARAARSRSPSSWAKVISCRRNEAGRAWLGATDPPMEGHAPVPPARGARRRCRRRPPRYSVHERSRAPFAKVKSPAKGVFPVQYRSRTPRRCGSHPRSALGVGCHRWARQAGCAPKGLRVCSDQRRSRRRRARWRRCTPRGPPGHS